MARKSKSRSSDDNADQELTVSKDTLPPSPSYSDIPDSYCKFDRFPGYQKLLVPMVTAQRLGVSNPFFRVHDAVAGHTTQIGGRQYINFASYNYLGLCGHPRVNKAAKEAIDRWGTSVSGSRLTSGERKIQEELESALAELYEVDDALVFVSGHATNVSTIGYLFGPKDLIIHDALAHDSIMQGVQLSGAHRRSFPHNDWRALDRILTEIRGRYERALVVVEGLYSMDGDFPDLPRLIEVKKRHKAFLMVDEAHALGVLGKTGVGLAEHFGVKTSDVDIWMGTLSKTLASCGGYIAGEKALVEHLRYMAPGFLYSVGISPPGAASALEALRIMKGEPERVERLQARGAYFLEQSKAFGVNVGTCAGYAVVPVIIGASLKAVKLSNYLFERGVTTQAVVYPGVEEKAARLRFFVCSNHTEEEIRQSLELIAAGLGL